MKRIVITASLAIILAGQVLAQGLYIRAGGVYGMPVGTASIGTKYIYTELSNSTINTRDVVKGTYGAGTNFSVAVGYKFNQNFMFDLTGQYLIGNKFETGSFNNYTTSKTIDKYISQAKGLFINPAFIFSAGFGKAAPYGKFGLVAGSPRITENESYYYDGDGIMTYDKTWVYKKGMALGFQAAIGMNWRITDKIDIYTEVNIVNMSWYAQKGELTKYMSNGTDYLPNLPVNQKLFDFVSSVDLNAIQDPSKPAQQLRVSYPFSTVSAQAGIRFVLFQKKSE
ncbi:MAG: outer membrane beta-barrel protein [Bacteroidales bacterium]